MRSRTLAWRPLSCRAPLAPTLSPTLARSLGYTQLCGIGDNGEGTYTTEGITKLCDGLKGTAVTSLKCAAAP